MEDKALFNEYYYGEIDTLVTKVNEGLNKTLIDLNGTVDLNDLYRAISYSTITYLNAVIKDDKQTEELKELMTSKADEYIRDFMGADERLTYKELYTLPLLMMDIAAFTIFATIKEKEMEQGVVEE